MELPEVSAKSVFVLRKSSRIKLEHVGTDMIIPTNIGSISLDYTKHLASPFFTCWFTPQQVTTKWLVWGLLKAQLYLSDNPWTGDKPHHQGHFQCCGMILHVFYDGSKIYPWTFMGTFRGDAKLPEDTTTYYREWDVKSISCQTPAKWVNITSTTRGVHMLISPKKNNWGQLVVTVDIPDDFPPDIPIGTMVSGGECPKIAKHVRLVNYFDLASGKQTWLWKITMFTG